MEDEGCTGTTVTLLRVSRAGGGHIECSERDICFRWARWAELCVPSIGGCPFGTSAGYLPIYLSPREPAADGRVLRIVRVYARFRCDFT